MSKRFPDKLDIRALHDGDYVLTEPLRYHTSIGGNRTITVPAGFETDLASIPRVFRWLFTGHGKSRYPAAVHDYLYAIRKDRKMADRIFKEALEDVGANWFMQQSMYRAVRMGGWVAYR